MTQQNIAVKLCGILQAQGDEVVTAQEWRLIGQEQDGSQLLTWVSTIDGKEVLNLGVYTNKTKTLSTLHTFEQKLNIIQASVNPTHSLLSYVVKVFPDDPNDTEPQYWPYLISLLPDKEQHPVEVEDFSTKQIMVQYVYGKSNKYSPGIRNDRLLLFKHLEYIKIYRTPMFLNECDDGTEKWGFDGIYPEPETIVKVFSWAQWDCANQILYYIHYRQPAQSFAEGEEVKSPTEMIPTLSAFQFHADLPHETVLNIPLSLPHACGSGAACGAYEDDPVPLRVHDCSLDLTILCDQRGMVAICHHYLYKALDDSATSLVADDVSGLKDGGVNFAYSITLLHHGRVLHAAVPDLPWSLAKSLRPSYLIYEENHLLVNIPRLYTHLVDISLHHEPCCHIVLATEWSETGPALAPLLGWGSHAMVDLNTLDVVCLAVTDKDITAAFKSDSTVDNRLAIMHYLIQHAANLDLAEELVGWMCLNQRERSSVGSMKRVMQEYLVAAAYQATRRSLPASAAALTELLPFTQHVAFGDARAGSRCVSVSVERLWNSSAVVLAPRQRVCQFAEDAWTRVWRALAKPARRRLEPATVRAKLRAGLQCYRPEALSRATTPLSPAAPPQLAARALDPLPFFEVDLCTASRQELVVAANLREVSVHLMREGAEEGKGGASEGKGGAGEGKGGAAEGSVHAVATRWVAAQLDASRALCRLICRALALTPAHHQRGFALIDALEEGHARVLCHVLQQFQAATEGVAFPLPQGFASFATYLGYRALPLQSFMQHVHRGLFELHVDALKAIVAEGGEAGEARVDAKLRLVQLAGEGRGRRALAAWAHRAALVLRAQDHAAALLSGGGRAASARCARPPAPPAAARLSPLDTFLDLLTAKASLHELDFNLIIEATLASLHRNV